MLKGFTKPLTKKGILYKLCGLWLVFHLDKSGSDDIDKLGYESINSVGGIHFLECWSDSEQQPIVPTHSIRNTKHRVYVVVPNIYKCVHTNLIT